MSSFETLKSQVTDGKIKIIHVEAIPRSISTALGRALNESGAKSVFINEPFNRMKHDVEDASTRILEISDPITQSSNEPLLIITKNMARNLTVDLFSEWMPVCHGVVWSIREPMVQISSLVTRIANDLGYEPGANRITQNELTPEMIQSASDFLDHGKVSKNFSKTSWEEIGRHYRSGHQPERSVVVDGGEFTASPTQVLQDICLMLGLAYSPRMVEGWENGYTNANTGYSTSFDDATHAWTGHATVSTGIVATSRPPLDLALLPQPLQDHITKVAIPVYKEMMNITKAIKTG